MTSVWRCFSHLANRRETATSLAVCRILICLVTLIALMDAREISRVIWLRPEDGGMFPVMSSHWLFELFGGLNPSSVVTVHGFACLFAGLGLVGVAGRFPMLLAAQSYGALTSLNENATGAYDSLIIIGLSVLFISGSHHTLSLECYFRTGRFTSRRLVFSFPRYLLTAQILLMYTFTGFQKVGLSWTPLGGYDALYYVLNDPTFTRFGRWTTSAVPALQIPLLKFATAVTWHWEQSAPLLALAMFAKKMRLSHKLWKWLRRTDWRIPWLSVGVLMHVGIALMLDVGPFSYISVSFYVAFFRPSDWRRLRQRWANQSGFKRLTAVWISK